MAKNRNNSGAGSHKQKRERLAEAKERRRQAKAEAIAYQRHLEKEENRFQASLLNSRKNRKPEEVIEAIWNGTHTQHLTGKLGQIQQLFQALIGNRPHREYLEYLQRIATDPSLTDLAKQLKNAKELILTLEKNRCRFWDRPAAEATSFRMSLENLIRQHSKWLRPLETWKPSSKNAQRQFADLIRHLLAKYSIPLFMDEAWGVWRDTPRIDWWIHVAQGGNIRTAPNLPTPLTKMMAHQMMQAPSNYTINAAIRWGQIHALGGNERMVRGLLDSTLCTSGDFQNDEFWLSFFRWIIANPMLDSAQYSLIIDYVRNQKFVTPIGGIAPPQPGFSFKDRQANTLVRQVEEWHERLRREGRAQERQKKSNSWEHHPKIQDFQVAFGPDNNQTYYQIVQLLSNNELSAEGSRLKHCVYSYGWSCASGRTSIWSTRRLSHPSNSSFELLGTIELINAENRVVQFRAKNNARPGDQAFKILNQWAGLNGLNISGWL
jgi:hypothetical protein